jgi:GT2 family glycosyltransferase
MFYGGGLDMIFQMFIENKSYDSLAILNSDVVVHGQNFFKTLRQQLFSDNSLMVISPCVIQPGEAQSFWKQMHCWNSPTLRYVPFIDYNAPFMKREFVEKVGVFGSKYGWVQDLVTGMICQDNSWKIAVCDWVPIVHIGNGTVKETPKLSNYNLLAQQEMDGYFVEKNLVDRANQLKLQSINYTWPSNS